MGSSPVHYAAERGHPATMKVLLERKPNLILKNGLAKTPLHLAAMGGHLEVVTLLLESPQSFKPSEEMPTPPPTAEEIAVVKYPTELPRAILVDVRTSNNYTPLHMATIGEHDEVVAKLLEYTLNPNIQNFRLETPLHIAVLSGNLEIVRLITRKIGQCNLTADQRNGNGYTALQLACRQNLATIVKLILPVSESPIREREEKGPACALKIAYFRRHIATVRVIEEFLKAKGIKVPSYNFYGDI